MYDKQGNSLSHLNANAMKILASKPSMPSGFFSLIIKCSTNDKSRKRQCIGSLITLRLRANAQSISMAPPSVATVEDSVALSLSRPLSGVLEATRGCAHEYRTGED